VSGEQSSAIYRAISVLLFWNCLWDFGLWLLRNASARLEQRRFHLSPDLLYLREWLSSLPLSCPAWDSTRKRVFGDPAPPIEVREEISKN
jgi:hypothetical protein